ncbi:helix-turn-helix domain-containing protein [Bradyrhizobium sp. BRP14]|nr:helix-turn-helix domain-containing protein [Bradyrhizobium sp. BRP14]
MGNSSYIPKYVPESYVVIGLDQIAAMFGVTRRTIQNWRQKEGFPIARLPGGCWCLSLGALDFWLLERSRIDPYAGGEQPLQFQHTPRKRAEARKVASQIAPDELQAILQEVE